MFSFMFGPKEKTTNTQESNQKPNPLQQENISNENKKVQVETLSFPKWLDDYLKSNQVDDVNKLKNLNRRDQILSILKALDFSNDQENLNQKINDKEKTLNEQEKAYLAYFSTEEKREILKDIVLSEKLAETLLEVKEAIENNEYKNNKDSAKNSDLYNQVIDMLKETAALTLATHKKYLKINEDRQKWRSVHSELPNYLQRKNEERVQKQQTWNKVMRQMLSTFDGNDKYKSSRKSFLTREGEPFEKQILNQFDEVIDEIKKNGAKEEEGKGIIKEIKTVKLSNLHHVETRKAPPLLQRGEPFTDPIPHFNEEEKGRYRHYQHLEKTGMIKKLHEEIEKFDRSRLKPVNTKEIKETLFNRSQFKPIQTKEGRCFIYVDEEEQKLLDNKEENKENINKENLQPNENKDSQNKVLNQTGPLKLFDEKMTKNQKKKLKKQLKIQYQESKNVLDHDHERKRLEPEPKISLKKN